MVGDGKARESFNIVYGKEFGYYSRYTLELLALSKRII